jgi:hypothetical protein
MKRTIGIYLGVVQFIFAATWIVYVIYLPQLAAQAGIGKGAVAWILMLDQLVFVVADYLTGVAADRAARVVGRIGMAFVALPFVAPNGSPAAFIALTVVWAVTSSALRAPPLTLVGRYAARPTQPLLLACSLLGLGVASAVGPYLGLSLRGVDPRVPFVMSSAALAMVTVGIVAAERLLRREPGGAATAPVVVAAMAEPTPLFVAAALLAALAFQVHVFIDSAPRYVALAGAADLPMLLPVFWIGFNLAMFPFSLAAKRWPAPRVMAVAAVVAAAAALAVNGAASVPVLVAMQLIAGASWAGVLVAAFAWALVRGGGGRAGTFAGALSSVLAMAALVRMASVTAGWPKASGFSEALVWWPCVGWLAAGAVVLALRRLHSARSAATPPASASS